MRAWTSKHVAQRYSFLLTFSFGTRQRMQCSAQTFLPCQKHPLPSPTQSAGAGQIEQSCQSGGTTPVSANAPQLLPGTAAAQKDPAVDDAAPSPRKLDAESSSPPLGRPLVAPHPVAGGSSASRPRFLDSAVPIGSVTTSGGGPFIGTAPVAGLGGGECTCWLGGPNDIGTVSGTGNDCGGEFGPCGGCNCGLGSTRGGTGCCCWAIGDFSRAVVWARAASDAGGIDGAGGLGGIRSCCCGAEADAAAEADVNVSASPAAGAAAGRGSSGGGGGGTIGFAAAAGAAAGSRAARGTAVASAVPPLGCSCWLAGTSAAAFAAGATLGGGPAGAADLGRNGSILG
jgi:hypothetical protein